MTWMRDVPLAGRTRYGIGGPARRLRVVNSERDLAEALATLGGDPFQVLGAGANVLVSDRGPSEAVLILGGEFDFVRPGPAQVEAGAAAGLPGLVGCVRRAGRTGFAFLEAVPGTVGGALRMNAGSTETGLWDRVLWVNAMTAEGRKLRLTREDAGAAYRSVSVPENWVFLAGAFDAKPGPVQEIEREHMRRRRLKVKAQVYDLPSCGSTWKNPGGEHGSAWEVVARVGMRGARHGGAQISEKHANFIANLGGARAEDVVCLMRETRRRAHEQLGVWLEPEIRLWGFDSETLAALGAAS